MRIAIPYDDGCVFPHFGMTQQFKVYDYEGTKLIRAIVMSCEGYSHIDLVTWLAEHEVNALICTGIGEHGRMALALADIKFYPGVGGDCDMRAQQLAEGTLEFDMNAMCTGGGCHH